MFLFNMKLKLEPKLMSIWWNKATLLTPLIVNMLRKQILKSEYVRS
jgi:hypothetical protein